MRLLQRIFRRRGRASCCTDSSLVLFAGRKKAHATAIAVMLPLTVVSLVTYHNSGAALPENAALVIVSATVGGIVGAALLKKLPAKILKLIFGAIMVFAGLKMFFG